MTTRRQSSADAHTSTADPTDSDAPLVTGEVPTRARAALAGMVASDRRVIEEALARPHLVVVSSITELAERAGTAASTVVRACKGLGYRGFQDLKIAVARDLALQSGSPRSKFDGVTAQTPTADVLHRILRASGRALDNATATADPAQFVAALTALQSALHVLVIGNGASSTPAQDAAYRLRTLGLYATAPTDGHDQHLAATHLNRNDACLVISHTGATRQTLITAEAATKRNAYVIAITSFQRSPLAQLADTVIVAGGPEQGFRLEAMTSRLAHLAVIDALFVGLAFADRRKSTTALDNMANISAEHSL